MKRVLCILVFAALFLGCLVPLCVWAETPEQTIAVRIGRNVDAYRRATPKSVFVGWAQAGGHYTVLETVRGYEDCEWIRIRLENGAEGYIPAYMTSPVVKDVESLTTGYVLMRFESDVNVRRRPDSGSVTMGMAKKGSVYPVIGEKVRGWWPVALENGTTGYVYEGIAYAADPAEVAKPRHVKFSGRSLIYAQPHGGSAVLTGSVLSLLESLVCSKNCFAELTGDTGFRSSISSHNLLVLKLNSSSLRRTATVMRQRSHVNDLDNFNTGTMHGTDG